MGLWREHFHWSVLLQWKVLGSIIGLLLGVARIVLAFDQYILADIFFMLTALFIFAKILQIAIVSASSPADRILFTFVLFGLVGVGIVETIRAVSHSAGSKETAKNNSGKESIGRSISPKPPENLTSGTMNSTEPEKPKSSVTTSTPPASTPTASEIAEELARRLPHDKPQASVGPPRLEEGPDPYRNWTSKEVADAGEEFATRILNKSNEVEQRVMSTQRANTNSKTTDDDIMQMFHHSEEIWFEKCCRRDALILNAELLKRLGPGWADNTLADVLQTPEIMRRRLPHGAIQFVGLRLSELSKALHEKVSGH